MHSLLRLRNFASVAIILLLAILLLLAIPSHSHAADSSVDSDEARAAPSTSRSSSSSRIEYDPDEIIGDAAAFDEEAEEEPADVNAAIESTPSVFVDPQAVAKSHDPKRVAETYDWVHLQYEIRLSSSSPSDSDQSKGKLIDSSRKLGREPLVVQLSAHTLLPQLDHALLGTQIGDRRTVHVAWKPEYATLSPLLPSTYLDTLDENDDLVYTITILRFDRDIPPLTWMDRFWNMLPMLAFFAFVGFRVGGMNPNVNGQQPDAGATAELARRINGVADGQQQAGASSGKKNKKR